MIADAQRATLLRRLDASRAGLLDALQGVTERDFGAQVDGQSVVQLLAALAQAEREAVATARGMPVGHRAIEKPMPPQVMHDLAGARYQSRRYVEDAADTEAAEAVVAGIEAREAEAARRVRERPRMEPLPVIPVIQP
jgi:hypothetical protein